MSSQLVIQTAFLGDLILSIPLLKKIKQRFPDDQLILVCKSGLGEFFLKEKIVDQVFEIKKNDRDSYNSAIQQLNQKNIDNIFCVHRSLRSQLMSLKVKARRKIAFHSFVGRFIFNDLIEFKKSWPEALRQLNILTSIDQSVSALLKKQDWSYLNHPNEHGHLPQVPKDLQVPWMSKIEKAGSKKVALFPGSVWATKKWTAEGFVQVGQYFLKNGFQVFLMGGPDEKEICLQIQKQCPQAQVIAGALSIARSIEFIRDCALVIANDSAPTHMAACQDVPVVSVFGPTTLAMGFRPWSSNAMIVENNNLNCRPCGKHGHQQCPLGHHKCMKDIEASRVIEASLQLLKTSSNNL